VELDEFLLKRTVCRIIDADERFASFKRTESVLENIKVKVIRSLGAETQLLTWNGSDVVLFDTTTVEYANDIFDVMMSAEVVFPERQKAMRSLLYKQWARGLFSSGFSLQSWILLYRSRRNDARINYSDDTTRLSEHISRNLKDFWETLFSAFLFAHELGHVLQKRGDLDQERYNQFLERSFLSGKVEDAQESLEGEPRETKKRFQDYLQTTLNTQVGMTDSAKSGIVDMFKMLTSNLHRAEPGQNRIRDALRVELLCDLYACDFLLKNFEFDGDEYKVCYLLPICEAVILFLKIGLNNRWWAEYLVSNYEVLRRDHDETETGKMMDAILEKLDATSSSLLEREAEDTVVRWFAITDYLIDAFNRKRAASAEGSKQQLEPFKTEKILPMFMANVWTPYRYLLLEALDETNNQWLAEIFSTAEDAEEAAKNGRLDSAKLGLPYSRQLRYEELAKATREQFLRENGF
jgi:hypothetical protein